MQNRKYKLIYWYPNLRLSKEKSLTPKEMKDIICTLLSELFQHLSPVIRATQYAIEQYLRIEMPLK